MKVTLLISVILMATQAFAMPKYMKAFGAAYPNFKKTSCSVCHNADNTRNAYGLDVGKNLAGGVVNFKAIEAVDSDGDSFANLEEINAGSMPGDKDSTPSRP